MLISSRQRRSGLARNGALVALGAGLIALIMALSSCGASNPGTPVQRFPKAKAQQGHVRHAAFCHAGEVATGGGVEVTAQPNPVSSHNVAATESLGLKANGQLARNGEEAAGWQGEARSDNPNGLVELATFVMCQKK